MSDQQVAAGAAVAVHALPEVAALRSSVRGEVLLPGDAGYDAARHVFNGMIDRHPRLIVRCADAADVISAVSFARENRLSVAVRGGGHNVAGFAVCDDGLMIDLSRMRGVRVDPIKHTARAEPGCTWGDFDHATQAFGLATTGGLVSSTGVAGFTLGGGIGWLVRKFGLACDNLLSVDVVTADGRLLTANAAHHKDLYWGVRGGGGNFGVVTSFEFRLHPVNTVLGGLVLYPLEQAREVLRFYRSFVAKAPESLTTLCVFLTAPPAPFVPVAYQGTRMFAVVVCYAGRMSHGEEVLRPLRQLGSPVVDLIGPMPYTALQTMFDEAAPDGSLNYWKASFLDELSYKAIDTFVERAAQLPSPLSAIHIHHLGGAIKRTGVNDNAFGHRDAQFVTNIVGTWLDPAENDRNIAWVRETWSALQPVAARGAYLNFMGEEGDDRVKAAYDAHYERLVAIKNAYDPTNLFHLNQNIPPSA